MNRQWVVPVFILQIIFAIGLLAVNLTMPSPSTPTNVLAVSATEVPSPKLLKPAIATPSPTPMPQIAVRTQKIDEQTKTKKAEYKIAFYGDSMIETMGGGLPYLYKELKSKYPQTSFVLYNYGIGAENMVDAISRFGLPYEYKDRSFEPVGQLRPDIIVLGSYAYNPLTPFDKNESWLLLADLISKAKATGAEVYLLAEQAPIKEGFATGIGGVNWPPEISDPHVEKILQGLDNAIGLAETTEIGLINVYEPSKAQDSKYGNPDLVAAHDGIHYSEQGQNFSAKLIAEALKFD